MRIDIRQQKISLGDKYKIFIAGEQTYSAASEHFRFLDVINLFATVKDGPCLTIRKRWSWFKVRYDIHLSSGDNVQFRTKSIWKSHYQCQYRDDFYDVYGHKGRKYSVFKNDRQIAWWVQDMVTFFEGDSYQIVAEDNSNHELIIAFCLIIDNCSSKNDGGGTATINLGNLGREARKFDPLWLPAEDSRGTRASE